jgi:hypothetical protein
MAQNKGGAQLTAPHRYYRHGVGTTDGGQFRVKNFEPARFVQPNATKS